MKEQEDFFGKLGMEPDKDEVIINDVDLAESRIPESEILEPVDGEASFFSEPPKTPDEEIDKKNTEAEEKFLRMRDSRPDIYN